MSIRSTLLTVALAGLASLPAASPAAAAPPASAAAFSAHALAAPTHFSAADTTGCEESAGNIGNIGAENAVHCDAYRVVFTDSGAKSTAKNLGLAATLPAGLTLVGHPELIWPALAKALGKGAQEDLFHKLEEEAKCSQATLSCASLPAAVAPGEEIKLRLYATVEAGVEEGTVLTGIAKVSGGGLPEASVHLEGQVSSVPPPFGIVSLTNLIDDYEGKAEAQAGGHPYGLATRVDLANSFNIAAEEAFTANSVEDPRDVLLDLPLGFLGSALATPETCKFSQFTSHISGGESGCPRDTIVGHIEAQSSSNSPLGPIYNMVPQRGAAAEFAFADLIGGTHVLYASVVPGPEGYVLRTTAREIPQIALTDIITSFYGVPAVRNGAVKEGAKELPFFTMPADCSGKPLITHIYTDSWQHPGTYLPDGTPNLAEPNWKTTASESAAVTGCNKLAGLFKPTIAAKPETNQADSPTGLEVDLKVPQTNDPEVLATPPLKKAVVTLPEGMTVNPSSANGLQGCSLAQLGMSPSGQPDAAPPHCPDASKIGEVELETPDLPGVLHGDIYVAKQKENPFNSLLAIYIVVNDPTTGVVIKLSGEVQADPLTGRLTTVVDNSPQFPFSELRTKFFGGTKAALRTPAVCGEYAVTSELTPWSAPQSGPPGTPTSSFSVSQNCAESADQEPNHPSFEAGTVSPTAGAFSPFVLKLHREDGSQELKGLNVALPEGLIGKLAGVGECSEAQLATARSREREGGGQEELNSPSCPASSEVGQVTVGAGAGLTPYYAQGKVYLAGPYKGAPLSLAIITPAVAGPFDLGDVLVRAALQVNTETTQISAVSDPLPTILDGIPLDLRSITLNMSRNQFTLNPTNCEKKAITGEALSILGQLAPLSNPFQVGGCKALGFKPKLKLTLKGSVKRTANPKLIANLTMKPGEANIARAQVKLPPSAFLDNAHIGAVCTKVIFAEGAKLGEKCPAASIYGYAKAVTPLLDAPVEGPVYLRSGLAGHKLPDLVAALNGQIQVALVGKTDSVKGALRNTFEAVPDAPVSSFHLELFGGKRGLIQMSSGFCRNPHAAVSFTGQNGKVFNADPVVASSCNKGGNHHGHYKRGKQ